ncbi:ABC transporter ATP-binding protein/permease [Chloroflexota bacterium]
MEKNNLEWAIETHQISKQFPKNQGWRDILKRRQLGPLVVNQVSLNIRPGELFGLLGPNGAGKTTFIKILCSLIIPTYGSARVNGYDLHQENAIRSSVGLLTSNERSFFWRLSAHQNLEFFARLYGLGKEEAKEQIEFALSQVGLKQVADKRFQNYSSGMRQRLSIARALLNQPKLLFLDEPSKGLDPTAVQQLHLLIRRLCDQNGITILLTTHDLKEAEELCDRIAIMNQGRILACGNKTELSDILALKNQYHIRVDNLPQFTQQRLGQDLDGLQIYSGHSDDPTFNSTTIEFLSHNGDGAINQAIHILGQDRIPILKVEHKPASLEQVFTRFVEDDKRSGSQEDLSVKDSFHSSADASAPNTDITKNTLGKNLRIAAAFFKRDFLSEASYRISFLLQLVSMVSSVAIFYFIAELLGDAATPYLADYGGDYFSFVLIGIAFANYVGTGLSGFSSSMRQAQTTGTMEAMLSTPTNASLVILSSSLWQYALTTVRVLFFLALGGIFMQTSMSQGNFLAAFVILVLTITALSSLGIIAASFIMVLKRGNPVTWIFNSLISLLGGVYYPIEILPNWLQWLAKLVPLTYSLQAMRLALLQGATFSDLYSEIFALVVFTLFLLPISLVSFRYAVRQAKIDGSLTHF